MSVIELGQVLIKLQVITRDQWQSLAADSSSLGSCLDRLQQSPAWWNAGHPALTPYQRRQIEGRLDAGPGSWSRELRLNDCLILDCLGKGGMAVVYKAWSIKLRQVVAVKRLTCNDHELRDRLQREASIMEQLNHPQIARFLGYEPIAEGDGFLLILEFIDGPTLESYISKYGPVSVPQAVDWLIDLLGALDHAHRFQIIHRDITSRNIMIQRIAGDGSLKATLLDFGHSKLVSPDGFKTVRGVVIGTPPFMSPEHFEDTQHVTEASDIYSLGCNAYVMLTGSPPFRETAFTALCIKHLNAKPPLLGELQSDIPPHVEHVIQHMLMKRPEERGSIPELIQQLRGNASAAEQAVKAVRQGGEVQPQAERPADSISRIPQPPSFDHPQFTLLSRFVPVSELSRSSRFIDPIPMLSDFVRLSMVLAKRVGWTALILALAAVIYLVLRNQRFS